MDKKIETIEIVAKDFYGDNCLNDSVGGPARSKHGNPSGYVEIYEVDESGNKKLVGKHNLVLYIGREWLAQRIINQKNPEPGVLSTPAQFISWFGLGDGGVIPGDPLNPAPPTLTDTNLNSQVMITTVDSSAADHWVIPLDSEHPEEGFYKIPFDSIAFEQDALNDDKWLVIKIVTTAGATYANDKQLSEAGLFTAESALGGYGGDNPPPGTFTIFSRVTFPSIVKTADRRLIFTWYLYV